jgi:BON domain
MAMFNIVRKPKGLPWGAIAALTAAVFGATAGLEWAAEPAPPLSEKKLTYRDIQLTVHARKALADDAAVGPGNLGVRVQNNVAVLWGPISSEELKQRAVEVVKKVKGVYEVRDADVYVAAPPPVVETAALPPPTSATDAPTHTESASPDPVSGAILSLASRSPVEAAPAPVVVLRAPLPLNGSSPTQTVSQAPPDEGLGAAVEQVRQNSDRFHPIAFRLEGDMVVLQLGDGQAENVMAFARAISRVPGLTRIVILSGDAAAPR